jgi:hypothetical protein
MPLFRYDHARSVMTITRGWDLAATKSDRLMAEVDRQLTEVRTMADGLATRSGLLVAGSALVAGLLGTRLPTLELGLAVAALIGLGLATTIGVLVLVPGLEVGPSPFDLGRWSEGTSERTVETLYAAKVLTLVGNRDRLGRMRVVFYFQTAGVVVAIALAIVAALWR